MLKKLLLYVTSLSCLLIADNIKNSDLNGNWHLRVMDGMEVRKARAILDFDMDKMKLSGFDACNPINATLIKNSKYYIQTSMLFSTRMACRNNVHKWVNKRLHVALKEGFSIKEDKKYGVKGITLKSSSHELFFKRMQRD